MRKINKSIKIICLLVFLYVAFFSIQNFYQGYHDVDTSFNFMRLGMLGDIGTDGKYLLLTDVYLRGANRMTYSFVWLTLDCLLAVLIGYLWRKDDNT